MRSPEHNLQVAVVKYLTYRGINFFAVPNGGRRDATTGAMLKKEGVLAGVSDLVLLLKDGEAVFVELKNGNKGQQSESQKAFQRKVESLGFTYLIWRQFSDAVNFVNGYNKLLREKVNVLDNQKNSGLEQKDVSNKHSDNAEAQTVE